GEEADHVVTDLGDVRSEATYFVLVQIRELGPEHRHDVFDEGGVLVPEEVEYDGYSNFGRSVADAGIDDDALDHGGEVHDMAILGRGLEDERVGFRVELGHGSSDEIGER